MFSLVVVSLISWSAVTSSKSRKTSAIPHLCNASCVLMNYSEKVPKVTLTDKKFVFLPSISNSAAEILAS